MAHWHDFNPWARTCIYISAEEMREVLGDTWPDEMLSVYGSRLDAYILPQPDGRYSFGIRYGKEGGDYLSPVIYREQGDKIMARVQAQFRDGAVAEFLNRIEKDKENDPV